PVAQAGFLGKGGPAKGLDDSPELVGRHLPRPRGCGLYVRLPDGALLDRSFSGAGSTSASLGCFAGDPAILLDRLLEGLVGLLPFLGPDAVAAHAPELFDGTDAPQGTLARGANRFAGDEHDDRVGVQLREVAEGHPAAPVDRDLEGQVVDLI